MRQLVAKIWRLATRMTSEALPTTAVTSSKRSLDDADGESQVDDKKQRLEDDEAQQQSKKRSKVSRKYAMLLSYAGNNYYGMQTQGKGGEVTIESKLLEAMVKAGVIGQELADKPLDFNFQRAARTDKAVSAVRQCCSMWLDLEKDANIDTVPSLINAQLPDDIRVMGLKRATKGFHCQKNCDSRTYSYTLPTFSFAPCVENTNMKFRISEEQLAEVNKLLGIYKGTHNFFNYTAKREHSDKSCFRYIISFECGKPFVYHDAVHGEVEFATIQIRGASFMLHQIRKMIGMVIAIMRGLANKSVIQKTWEEKRVDVPRAPGLGLMLEKVHYTTYDRKFSKTHATLDEWPECAAAIEEFREKCILANILKTEMKDNSMMNWLSVLLYHTYDGCEEGAPKPFCHAQHQINAANASESTENDKDTDAAERDDEKDDVTERKGIEGEGDSLVQADEGAKNVKAAIGER